MIPQCARLAAGNDDWLWFDDPAIEELWPSTLETLSMVGLSSLIAVVFGALLGVVLKARRYPWASRPSPTSPAWSSRISTESSRAKSRPRR